MRYLHVLLGLAALLGAVSAEEGISPPIDVITYVDASNANTSFSDSDTLWMSSASGTPAKIIYISVENDFGSAGVFTSESVKSATLKLYAQKIEKPGKINAYFVHGATFDTATWNDKPEYDQSVSSSLDIQDEGKYYSIDVTPLIKKAIEVCVEGCPYSIALVAQDDASIEISKEGSEKPTLTYSKA